MNNKKYLIGTIVVIVNAGLIFILAQVFGAGKFVGQVWNITAQVNRNTEDIKELITLKEDMREVKTNVKWLVKMQKISEQKNNE